MNGLTAATTILSLKLNYPYSPSANPNPNRQSVTQSPYTNPVTLIVTC